MTRCLRLLATVIPVWLTACGCAFRRHSLSIPGIGTFERVEVTPWGQTRPLTRYAFTPDSMWFISLAVVALALTVLGFWVWRRTAAARRVSSLPPT